MCAFPMAMLFPRILTAAVECGSRVGQRGQNRATRGQIEFGPIPFKTHNSKLTESSYAKTCWSLPLFGNDCVRSGQCFCPPRHVHGMSVYKALGMSQVGTKQGRMTNPRSKVCIQPGSQESRRLIDKIHGRKSLFMFGQLQSGRKSNYELLMNSN